MRAEVLGPAIEVIKASSRQKPADGVLRELFRSSRSFTAEDAAAVSRSVFGYYRWFRWVESRKGLGAQVAQAMQLAERFAQSPQSFPDADLIARAVPEWLNQEMPVTASFVRALQRQPKVWLRARPGQGRALGKKMGNCHPFAEGVLADALDYTGTKDLFSTREFHAGEFEMQDLHSQCVGVVCHPSAGETWWDACAGEGGKLLHLSDLMQNKGLIWASDRAEWRLRQLKRRAARAHVFNYRAAKWDGFERLPTRTKFDGILIDAPCSGVGTWHRNPQGRWTTTPRDIQELAALQVRLVVAAAQALKPEGKLVFSVCTLTRSETEAVEDAVEKANLGLQVIPVENPLLPGNPEFSALRLRLEETGGNGMFVVCWRRKPLNTEAQDFAEAHEA